MKLTKEDYMRLPKERLAELLVERDNGCFISIEPTKQTPMPTTPSGWGCDGTVCTNPRMDCITCPRRYYVNPPYTATSITKDKTPD